MQRILIIKGHSHVAKWIGELALSVADDDSGDALLPSLVLATFGVPPVCVAVLLREDLALQRDQVAWLAIAAKGVRLSAPRLLKEGLLVDNGLEVRSLVVPVLNGFVVGDLNAVHLQLEVVPWREKHFRTSPIHN